ncbi:hypothetical protein ABKA04_008193 [Annulohypoxylon sp. FPYF3050]
MAHVDPARDLKMTPWEIDPSGDVLLTLYNPNAPFAVWSPDEKIEHDSLSKTESELDPDTTYESESESMLNVKSAFESTIASELTDSTEKNLHNDSPRVAKYLVSSKHLILASKYFENLFRGPWMEGAEVHSDGCRHVSAEDWDEEALLILMKIIHGRNKDISRTISLEMYAKIAVLVDYYKCHEAVILWSDIWKTELLLAFPAEFGRDLVLWILITSVFEDGIWFKMATKIAINHGDNDLPTMNLPILAAAGRINFQRRNRIRQICDFLFGPGAVSGADSFGCDFTCSSFMLGALILQMHKNGLDSKPKPPYTGYSIDSVLKMIQNFETPEWPSPDLRLDHVECTVPELLAEQMGCGDEPGIELSELFHASIDD